MGDWIGLLFFIVLAFGIAVGLKLLSKPRTRTAEEFERNASESTAIGANMNALQELMNPEAAKSKEVIAQMKDGRYQTKKREGKANSDDLNVEKQDGGGSND
ncbi:MAG: hypothetical protein WBD22_09840 [Pyrinomonadaceae bacterium]